MLEIAIFLYKSGAICLYDIGVGYIFDAAYPYVVKSHIRRAVYIDGAF